MKEKNDGMPPGSWENLTPKERMKWEIAEEMGVLEKVKRDGWKSLSARETGKIGGLLTSRMKARQKKAQKNEADSRTEAAN